MSRQPSLFDSLPARPESTFRTAPFQRTSETSREAAARVRPRAGTQMNRVLAALEMQSDTIEGLHRRLRIPVSSVCARLAELRERGLAEDSGDRALTSYGFRAVVWRARESGGGERMTGQGWAACVASPRPTPEGL